MPRRSSAPLWLMGLTNSVFGMFGGILIVSIPQLLSARHVAETTIASLTALIISPGFWACLFSPLLDVKFSRRWYAVATALLSSLCLILAFHHLDNLRLIEVLLLLGFFFANLYQSALG